MRGQRGPTLRARWLGRQLRTLRETRGLTLQDAGDYLQRDPSTISRIESGITPGRVADVLALLNLYGVTDENVRNGLEQLSRDIWRKGWWDGYAGGSLRQMIDHAWLEAHATTLRTYDVMGVPGLLQTRAYAQEVISSADPDASREERERWLEFRMTRQSVLTRDDPPRLEMILDEAALRRVVGSPKVTREQLRHLLTMAERPGIALWVLPFDAHAHASPEGPFAVLNMPAPFPDVAYVETRGGTVYVEAEEAESFARAYDLLMEAALPPRESLKLIAAVAERME
jgi:transcriptional regulator with XRE-family HTH domain